MAMQQQQPYGQQQQQPYGMQPQQQQQMMMAPVAQPVMSFVPPPTHPPLPPADEEAAAAEFVYEYNDHVDQQGSRAATNWYLLACCIAAFPGAMLVYLMIALTPGDFICRFSGGSPDNIPEGFEAVCAGVSSFTTDLLMAYIIVVGAWYFLVHVLALVFCCRGISGGVICCAICFHIMNIFGLGAYCFYVISYRGNGEFTLRVVSFIFSFYTLPAGVFYFFGTLIYIYVAAGRACELAERQVNLTKTQHSPKIPDEQCIWCCCDGRRKNLDVQEALELREKHEMLQALEAQMRAAVIRNDQFTSKSLQIFQNQLATGKITVQQILATCAATQQATLDALNAHAAQQQQQQQAATVGTVVGEPPADSAAAAKEPPAAAEEEECAPPQEENCPPGTVVTIPEEGEESGAGQSPRAVLPSD